MPRRLGATLSGPSEAAMLYFWAIFIYSNVIRHSTWWWGFIARGGKKIHKRKKRGVASLYPQWTHKCWSKGYGPDACDSALIAMAQLIPQLNEGHWCEQRESPNCCLFANGAVDDHLPLLGLNVRGGYIGPPAASLNCTLQSHLHLEQLVDWTEHRWTRCIGCHNRGHY